MGFTVVIALAMVFAGCIEESDTPSSEPTLEVKPDDALESMKAFDLIHNATGTHGIKVSGYSPHSQSCNVILGVSSSPDAPPGERGGIGLWLDQYDGFVTSYGKPAAGSGHFIDMAPVYVDDDMVFDVVFAPIPDSQAYWGTFQIEGGFHAIIHGDHLIPASYDWMADGSMRFTMECEAPLEDLKVEEDPGSLWFHALAEEADARIGTWYLEKGDGEITQHRQNASDIYYTAFGTEWDNLRLTGSLNHTFGEEPRGGYYIERLDAPPGELTVSWDSVATNGDGWSLGIFSWQLSDIPLLQDGPGFNV